MWFWRALAAGILLAGGGAGTVRHCSAGIVSGVLDQAFTIEPQWLTWNSVISNQHSMAQTLQVGEDGILSGVALQVWRDAGTSHDLKVQIKFNSPANPVTAATVMIHPQALVAGYGQGHLAPLTEVDLRSAGIVVHKGDVLAIVLSTKDALNVGTTGYSWGSSGQGVDSYTAGDAWVGNLDGVAWQKWQGAFTKDQGFETFVTPVPEAGSVGMLGMGAGMLMVRRRRVLKGV